MKYRKKPIVIDAWIWDESQKTLDMIGCGFMSYSGHASNPDLAQQLRIRTLEGDLCVYKGDYIIKDIKGEFYPVRADKFKETYERAV